MPGPAQLSQQILTFALPLGVGFALGRTPSWTRRDTNTLSRLTVDVLLPALVIRALAFDTSLDVLRQAPLLVACGYFSLLFGAAVAYPVSLFATSGRRQRVAFLVIAGLSNTAFLGFPILFGLYRHQALARAVLYDFGLTVAMYSVGLWMLGLAGGTSAAASLKDLTRSPIFWAFAAGLTALVFRLRLPDLLRQALDPLAQASVPVALLVIGCGLSATDGSPVPHRRAVLALDLTRLLLIPAAGLVLLVTAGVRGLNLNVIVLQLAMPASVTGSVLAGEMTGQTALASRTVATSTLLAIVTLPLWVEILTLLGK